MRRQKVECFLGKVHAIAAEVARGKGGARFVFGPVFSALLSTVRYRATRSNTLP